jgi:hypothetical protein
LVKEPFMKTRKTIMLILSLLMITGNLKSRVYAIANGTISNPWQISTVDDLKAIGTVGDWDDAYILMNDLVLSSENWVALGSSGAHLFKGTFNGNNHQISGLTISLTDSTSDLISSGLFYALGGATILDLSLTAIDVEITVTDPDLYVGALAGFAQAGDGEKLQIDHVVINGSMSVTYHYDTQEERHRYVGGMIGQVIGDNDPLKASIISNNFLMIDMDVNLDQSFSDSYLYQADLAVGGYIGHAVDVLFQSNVLDKSELTFTTDVYAQDFSAMYLGGIVGLYSTETDFAQSDKAVFLDNTVRSSTIKGVTHVGGLIGAYTSSVDNLMREAALSDVVLSGDNRVGGIMGNGEHLSLENVHINSLSMISNLDGGMYFGGIVAYGSVLSFKGIISIDDYLFRKSISTNYAGTVGSVAGLLEHGTSTAFITVKNSDIIAGNNVGGVFGSANFVTLEQATVQNSSITGDNLVGGIAGGSHDISFSNVSFDGIITGIYSVGGIVGYLDARTTIDHAIAQGEIHSNGWYAGGLVGKSVSNYNESVDVLTMTESYARSTLYYTYNSNGVGGLIGCGTFTTNKTSNPIHLTDVYFAGEMIFVPDDEHSSYGNSTTLGPILGLDAAPNFNHTFDHVYYDSDLYTGSNPTGVGTGKTTAEMMVKTGYGGFVFTGLDHWFIYEAFNDGYATFNPGLIRVDYVDVDGTLLAIQILDPNTVIIPIKDPVLDGFVFVHWVDESQQVFDFSSTISESVVLKAIYKEALPETGQNDGTWLWFLSLSLGLGLISRKKKNLN